MKKNRSVPAMRRTTLQEEALKLEDLSSFSEFGLAAGEFRIGKLHEFFFDDNVWAIRYIAADADTWAPGKKALISTSVLGEPDSGMLKFPVFLDRNKIQDLPLIGIEETVSRLHQIQLYKSYGWLPYWVEAEYHNVSGRPLEVVSGLSADSEMETDKHLFSTLEMVDYTIQAIDGETALVKDISLLIWKIGSFITSLLKSESRATEGEF